MNYSLRTGKNCLYVFRKKSESRIEDLKPSTVYGRKYILFIFYITPFHARLQIS